MNWYRQELKNELPELITKRENIIGVKVDSRDIRRMKTVWGTSNIEKKRIWFNLELVKKPHECLEYIVVHEMVHFLERTHNDRFVAYMDRFMPKWKLYKDELNSQILSHEVW